MNPVARLRSPLSCALVLLTLGCATIDSQPFDAYRDAALAVQASADEVLAVDYEWTRRSYVEKLAAGEDVSPADLILEFPIGDYGWELPPGDDLLARVRETQIALAQLNAAFVNYTTLLAELANGSLADSVMFGALAETINEQTTSAAGELGFANESAGMGLFSSTAMTLAAQYIDRAKRELLADIVAANQDGVERFAAAGSEAAKLVARDLKAEYQNNATRVVDAWPGASEAKQKRLAEEMLDLNADVIAYLETLSILDGSYDLLARKHEALRHAATGGEFSVTELLDIADRLSEQYARFKDGG